MVRVDWQWLNAHRELYKKEINRCRFAGRWRVVRCGIVWLKADGMSLSLKLRTCIEYPGTHQCVWTNVVSRVVHTKILIVHSCSQIFDMHSCPYLTFGWDDILHSQQGCRNLVCLCHVCTSDKTKKTYKNTTHTQVVNIFFFLIVCIGISRLTLLIAMIIYDPAFTMWWQYQNLVCES